tara:strand:+ start:400 stop:1737 length:1338 start_codon:yes stop_codon:yes gene_type:complete
VYTKNIDSKEFYHEIFNLVSCTKNLLSENSDLYISSDIISNDIIQKYIFFMKDNPIHEKIIKPMLLDSVFRAELQSSGAGEICLALSLSMLENIKGKIYSSDSPLEIIKDIDKDISEINRKLKLGSRKLQKKDLYRLIDKRFKSESQREIVKTIIENSSVTSPVFLEKTLRKNSYINFENGFNFKVNADPVIFSLFDKWKRENVECVIIDGMVESVSEIHHLLEKASSEKKPYILFVRHLAEEVRKTIHLNLQRGTIDLIPIEVGLDEKSVNILSDIALCCNSEVISAYKGDLISTSTMKDFPRVKKVTLSRTGLNIINDVNKQKLSNHLKYLKKKRDFSNEPVVKEIYDERIKALISGKVILKVGVDEIRKDRKVIEKLDKFFRELGSLIQTGVIRKSSLSGTVIDRFIKDDISSRSAYFASNISASVLKNIISVGGVICQDEV